MILSASLVSRPIIFTVHLRVRGSKALRLLDQQPEWSTRSLTSQALPSPTVRLSSAAEGWIGLHAAISSKHPVLFYGVWRTRPLHTLVAPYRSLLSSLKTQLISQISLPLHPRCTHTSLGVNSL